MRLVPLLPLALLCLLPAAAAQTPEDVVLLACETAGSVDPQARDALPLCPREEPPAPAPAVQAAAPPPPAAPGADAQQLADAIAAEAGRAVEAPTEAPGRLVAIVELVVAFVRDALELPAEAASAAGAALSAAGDAARATAVGAGEGAREALGGAMEALRGLFDRDASMPAAAPPARAPGVREAADVTAPLVGELLRAAAGPHPGHS